MTGISPSSISSKNANVIFHKLYGNSIQTILHKYVLATPQEIKYQEFHVNDYVRILKQKGVFAKRYHDNFSMKSF